MEISEAAHMGEQGPYQALQLNSADPACYEYSSSELFHYNYFIWMVGFILGLNFTHLDEGPMQHFTLDIEVIKTWGVGMWIFFGVIALLLAVFLIDLLGHYFAIGYFKYYLLLGVLMFGVVYLFNKCKTAQGKMIHLHHYVIALLLLPFICYQCALASFVQAFVCGMHIEGGVRWGFDSIWEDKEI